MKRNKSILKTLMAALAMLVLILDARSAITGARDGIFLCTQTVIPSLFPFFLLSTMLTSALSGYDLPILRPLGRLLHTPRGAESIYLTGLLGGYPVGAQITAMAYCNGQLSKRDAERMLSFCSNCGPAFIFGIGYTLFDSTGLCWTVWGIHILSSAIVGMITPSDTKTTFANKSATPVTLPDALKQAVHSMAIVCGWVIILRVMLSFLDRWVLWLLPTNVKIMIYGLMELSNGCCSLGAVSPIGLRMILFCAFLGFGGVCVTMQTWSAVEEKHLDPRQYFPGKITQCAVSILLAAGLQIVLPASLRWTITPIPMIVCALVCIAYYFLCRKMKKAVAFRRRLVYNEKKCT